MAGEVVELLQQIADLPRQWHLVGAAHLRPLRRNVPDCLVEIDIGPLRKAKFARSQEHVRCYLERHSGDFMALEGINRPEQVSSLCGRRDRGEMGCFGYNEGTAQISRRIAARSAGCDRIAEDSAKQASQAPGGFESTGRFDFLQRNEEFRAAKLADWPLA